MKNPESKRNTYWSDRRARATDAALMGYFYQTDGNLAALYRPSADPRRVSVGEIVEQSARFAGTDR